MAFSKATGVSAKPTGGAPATQTIALGFSDGKAVILWATLATAEDTTIGHQVMAWGISDGTTAYSVCGAEKDNVATTVTNRRHANRALTIIDEGGTLVAQCDASFSGTDLVLTWVTNNAVAYLIHYLVLGGSDLANAKVVNTFKAKITAAGTIVRTGIGFAPDFCFFITDMDNNAAPANAGATSNFFGASAKKDRNEVRDTWCGGFCAEKAVAATNNVESERASISLHAALMKGVGPSSNGYMYISSWDNDGWTEQWDEKAGAEWYFGVLILQGLQYDIKAVDTPTATGNDVQTGFGFKPEAMLHFCCKKSASGPPLDFANNADLGMGACTSTSDEHAVWAGDLDAVSPSQADQRSTATYHLLHMEPGTPTLDVQASLVSFDSGGFTQNFATAPAASLRQAWIAFGPALPQPRMSFPDVLNYKREIVAY